MAEFTKERIEQFIKSPLEHGLTRSEQMEMARQLLAGLEHEPVGEVVLGDYDDCGDYPDAKVVCTAAQGQADWNNFRNGTKLYAAPQLPQPAMIITQHFDTLALDVAKMVMCDVNRRHEFLGGDVQLLSRIQCRIDEACRAAMLQGSDPVSHGDELPMDYQQGHKDGLEWAARLAEANHPQTGDWLYDDPIELAKAIRKGPDMPVEPMQGWIPCSERMPDADGNYWGWWSESKRQGPVWFIKSELQAQFQSSEITHWMPLPACPKGE
ncbi:DUF551 domain-containing protein [Leclercia sp.]|uniref:DUF551 domain-containing protein n=1 Tax=Leclercia sp. TaxID=1898428 RepID=UPI0028B11C34|nr:DUF551 domain-containing protein [Leclercia sp.]